MPTPLAQRLSRTLYTTDGTTTVWDFAFSDGYLDAAHVKARVDTPEGLRTELVVTPLMLIGEFQLEITPALAAGDVLTIYRDTPKDAPLVNFTDESGFSEIALDTNARQAVMVAAETADEVNTSDIGVASEAAIASAASANAALLSQTAAATSAAAANSAKVAAEAAKTAAEAADDALRADLAMPTGSSLIAFTPAGVGAVIRDVQTKLRDSVSVKDFGAVGDGVTDDTAAVQAAFNVGGVQHWMPGVYICNKISVTKDITIYGDGVTLLHKSGVAAAGNGLIESLGDFNFTFYGLTLEGNAANQTNTVASGNLVWCSIGSMGLYNCTVKNSRLHLVRTGNIDNFNASYFAHDVVIANCTITNGLTNSGDCVRIERTNGAWVHDNYVYGGLSSIRTQLYCKNLRIHDNESCYSYADVGITVAMSENLEVLNNNCHHHYHHGIEVDAVVNCRVENNFCHDNGNAVDSIGSGIQSSEFGASNYANSALYAGSIASGYGVNYSNQTFASPKVPNINTTFAFNKCTGNKNPDRLIGLSGDVYHHNVLSNSAIGGGYTAQLSIEGGTLNSTSVNVVENTFILGAADARAIQMSNYQFTARIQNNTTIGNKPLAPYAAVGMRDCNDENRYLLNSTLRHAAWSDVVDATSSTGFAITEAYTGTGFTRQVAKVLCSGAGEKLLRLVARCAASTVAVQFDVNLYTAAGAYVTTLLAPTSKTLTTAYQEFTFRIPAAASNGNYIIVEIVVPAVTNSVYINECNVFMLAN